MPESVDIVDELPRTSLFEGISDDERNNIANEMQLVTFDAGQLIFSRGEEGEKLYVVLEGRVRLSVLTADGRELSFTHATPGNTFGEIAMLDGNPRTADATAITKLRAVTLRRDAFFRLMKTVPLFTQNLIQMLCSRLREADFQLEGVALHRIEVRLARFLAELAAQKTADQTDHEFVAVELGMPQGELALLLGASRPKVNSALMLLEDQGALKRDGGQFFCNLEQLKLIAEME